jgi:hypothetical protein
MSELAERFDTHDPGAGQPKQKRSAAMPARSCATSPTGAPAPATATAMSAGASCAGPAAWCSTMREEAASRRAVRQDGRLGRRDLVNTGRRFVTAIGAGTTYPDYKPAPFIVSQEVDGVDSSPS